MDRVLMQRAVGVVREHGFYSGEHNRSSLAFRQYHSCLSVLENKLLLDVNLYLQS